MAIVIHTRKGKYLYAYEHIRIGGKVVSKYMYPVNKEGDKIKQYQGKVAQHGWDKVTADAYEKGENLFIQKGYNPQTNKYIIVYGDRSKPKSIKRLMVNTEKEADTFIKEYINKDKKDVQQHKQYKVIKDEKYYNKEVDKAQQRLYKQYAAEDIKSNAAERHKKAEIIFADNKNYFIEYGVTKDGKIIKEGFKDSFKADEKATDEHFKTSTYDRKRERLGHYSKAGYKVVITKKELKPQYKKEITKLLGKKVK